MAFRLEKVQILLFLVLGISFGLCSSYGASKPVYFFDLRRGGLRYSSSEFVDEVDESVSGRISTRNGEKGS
jgi:hypothetical protein